MSDMSKQVEPTITTAVEAAPSTSSPTGSSPTRRRGSRQAPPAGLDLSPKDKLAPPVSERQDFPSPGTAPKGQRIFDANAVAEDKGVETVTGGWAQGVQQQEKLEEEYEKQDDASNKSPTNLKQKIKDVLHRE